MALARRSRVAVAAALGLLFAAFAAWSCLIYDASLLLPADELPDVSNDTGVEAGPPSCRLARWPERPDASPNLPSGTIEFVAAAESVDYGLERDGAVPEDFGYDLDKACTCFDAGAGNTGGNTGGSCRPSGDASPACDLHEGRDSNTLKLLVDFTALTGDAFSQKAINESIRLGAYGLLVRVRNYNGLPDDPYVEVSIFNSAGSLGYIDAGPDGGDYPKRDGTDVWTVEPDSLQEGVGPPDVPDYAPVYVNTTAYVSNYQLVAVVDFPLKFGRSPGPERVASVTVDLKNSVVSGRLVEKNGGWAIENGTMAGRWPARLLLKALEVLPDPFDPAKTTFLCGDNTAYKIVKTLVCDGQDIVSDERQDNTGAPCDSISFSARFSAGPAKLGPVVPIETPPKPCGVAWADDCAR